MISYIPQDIYLIDDTIKRNIAFGIGDDNINEEAIIRSTKLAQINKFISDLPLGFDTVVGNRGIRLSGGQRQRIGIARALYHDPAILILDEATSSLDYATEKKLIEDILSEVFFRRRRVSTFLRLKIRKANAGAEKGSPAASQSPSSRSTRFGYLRSTTRQQLCLSSAENFEEGFS